MSAVGRPLEELRILFLEPFAGGSHAAFLRTLTEGLSAHWSIVEFPARHWKWRMRGAALWVGEQLRPEPCDLVFATSLFPLAELAASCPHLAAVPKVLYFHENQFAYPSREEFHGERDTHFGFTQIAAAAAADVCVFNSEFNRESFLHGANELVRKMPDARPTATLERIAERSMVRPLPLALPEVDPLLLSESDSDRAAGPLILWNHRWEHDKNPERFFAALRWLQERGIPFRLAVCGESFRNHSPIFDEARTRFEDVIEHWGYCESRAQYVELLQRAQLGVSTSDQEFFGIATLEATHCGARPVVPDRLSFRELFDDEYRYADADLEDVLANLCSGWIRGTEDLRADRRNISERFATERVLPQYRELFEDVAANQPSYIGRNTS